ncbi:MAG: cache domain-containing protein, partial [Cyanobacteria bacterium P01_C01_bin.38]
MVAEKLDNQIKDKDSKGFLQRFSIKNRIPLRTLLVVPFVLQVVGIVGLVGYVSFKNSQDAVTKAVSELRSEISDRIELHLHDYLKPPHLINQNNAQLMRLGILDLNEPDTIARKFWQQKQIYKDVNIIFLGNEDGGYVGADITNKTTITRNFKAGQLLIYNTEGKGRRFGIPKLTNPNYDARKRPWYEASKNSKRPQWSDIYTYNDGSDIAIAATRPIYNNGKFEGVLAADLSLKQITTFLQKVKVGKTGQVFIVERDGTIIGSSTNEKAYFKKGDKIERLSASNSTSPLISKSVQFLKDKFGSLNNIKETHQLEFELEDKDQLLQVTTFNDKYGLDWLIVIVIPEADFMAQIDENRRNTLLLCLLALVMAIVVSIIMARRISLPVSRLNQAAKDITEGEWEKAETVQGSRIDEVGELANSFKNMTSQLHESFENLEEKNRELERLDKLKDEFLANTSHELRTPLNGMIGLAESII